MIPDCPGDVRRGQTETKIRRAAILPSQKHTTTLPFINIIFGKWRYKKGDIIKIAIDPPGRLTIVEPLYPAILIFSPSISLISTTSLAFARASNLSHSRSPIFPKYKMKHAEDTLYRTYKNSATCQYISKSLYPCLGSTNADPAIVLAKINTVVSTSWCLSLSIVSYCEIWIWNKGYTVSTHQFTGPFTQGKNDCFQAAVIVPNACNSRQAASTGYYRVAAQQGRRNAHQG